MRTKNSLTIYFAITVVVFLTENIQAFTFSKDTVYEDGFPHWNPDNHRIEKTNDKVTLINNSSEADTIKNYNFFLNNGKYAELRLFWGIGNPQIDKLILLKAVGNEDFYQSKIRVIEPNGTIVLSSFELNNCLACPVGSSAISSVGMDTVVAFLILKSTKGLDTLRIVGDMSTAPVSNKMFHHGSNKKFNPNFYKKTAQSNSLGVLNQSENLNTPQMLFNIEKVNHE